MSTVRIVGDVHAQVDADNLFTRGARPYFQIISDAPYSVQVGDMGDGETYDRLTPHCLGDFGAGPLASACITSARKILIDEGRG